MSEPRGKTLWELFKERLASNGAGHSFYNPLNHRVGSGVAVDHAAWRGFDFTVREIREYTRRLGGQEFRFTDYVLTGTNTGTFDKDDEVTLRLRAVPNAVGAYETLLLELSDDLAYAEELHNVVRDTTGKFDITDNATGQVAGYCRINDVPDAYQAAVLIIKATSDAGAILATQFEPARLEYWDYWRDVTHDAGRTAKEFLFVEMNLDTGWFQLWLGGEFFP